MKLTERIKGDAVALLVWGVATCGACRGTAQTVPADGTYVKKAPHVAVSPFVANALQFQYDMVSTMGGIEAGFCLYGTRGRDTIKVERAEFPFVHSAGRHHIRMSCRGDDDFLGFGHTHDYRSEANQPCLHSPIDLGGFSHTKNPLSLVYCGEGRMSTLTRR